MVAGGVPQWWRRRRRRHPILHHGHLHPRRVYLGQVGWMRMVRMVRMVRVVPVVRMVPVMRVGRVGWVVRLVRLVRVVREVRVAGQVVVRGRRRRLLAARLQFEAGIGGTVPAAAAAAGRMDVVVVM